MSILEKFEIFLKDNYIECKSFHPYFEEALNYMLRSGGKHFRAQLLLGVVEELNPSYFDNALRVALALEMIHTYSLIHDDLPIMDNADLRRGNVTTHKKFDEVTALLVGDALNTRAFYEITQANLDSDIKLKCIESLSFSAGCNGMVLGQAIDCFFEDKKLDIEEITFIHNNKTGALIASSLQMGAIISKLSDKKVKEIYDIGIKLGLAFQIQDDIIDATNTQEEAGKPTNNDKSKNSFTNLIGVEKSIKIKNQLIEEISKDIQSSEPQLVKMIENLTKKYLKG
ncbi:geranyl diphosphate synthase / farnesyl diphosphate synthase [Campylobacter blaseri]|uniref:Geranyl transferase n=1 Tax=Campylobacter blaseri TaxID=2042961 RepID=A0A2P8R3V7_9BACT|nr:polyprenyl synthetase family protein [Campylobacter blaseri]PSM53190.1 geranyl transferase [Campylobacter blaseri]PSM54656.1 geranyl transferase [Campylobacter blaseri]QKF86867.1 geranyl diphosphate synthase / farnesyl diphosphate synthase [Campylobacter blaseri]